MLAKIFLIIAVVVVLAIIYYLYSNYKKFGYHIRDNQVIFVESAPGGLEFVETVIPEADATTFKIIDKKYAYDASRVYFVGRVIESANPKHFQVIEVDASRVEDVFSKDDQHVFKFSSPLKGIDPASFEIIVDGETVIFKDKNQTYDSNGKPK